MITAWKQWLYALSWQWRWWRQRRFEKSLSRYVKKCGDALEVHYELQARLKRLRELPSIPYNYRIGRRITFDVFYSNWGVWQQCADEVVSGIEDQGGISDTVAQKGAYQTSLTMDDYLMGYQPSNLTLDGFLEELIRDGSILVEALRVAEARVDPHRVFYYRTRSSRLIRDLDALVTVMTHVAMDPDYVK